MIWNALGIALCVAGAALIFVRLRVRPAERDRPTAGDLASAAELRSRTSLIVPARNEAANLRRFFAGYPGGFAEVIVVDDESSDDTAAVAAARGAVVVEPRPRPPGWTGKNWACHEGAHVARGASLLFMDADTELVGDRVDRFFAWVEQARTDMACALPYHRAECWWERLMGPFHLAVLFVTDALGTPRSGKVYANGQFLYFGREAYDAIGGHEAVHPLLAEDLALAERTLAHGLAYRVYLGPAVYRVRMYETLAGFFDGWVRNFRLGLRSSRRIAPLEMFLFFNALVNGGVSGVVGLWALPFCLGAWYWLAHRQRRFGDFSIAGLFVPLGLSLFCLATAVALFTHAVGRPLAWKGREYRGARHVSPSRRA